MEITWAEARRAYNAQNPILKPTRTSKVPTAKNDGPYTYLFGLFWALRRSKKMMTTIILKCLWGLCYCEYTKVGAWMSGGSCWFSVFLQFWDQWMIIFQLSGYCTWNWKLSRPPQQIPDLPIALQGQVLKFLWQLQPPDKPKTTPIHTCCTKSKARIAL